MHFRALFPDMDFLPGLRGLIDAEDIALVLLTDALYAC